jgi:PST family polysaccharide transporter
MTLATSWWYRRRIEIPVATVTATQMRQESGALLKLGFAFMASGVMTAGGAYVVRIIIIRHTGLDALGSYQAAWALGGQYIGFILQAMGSDFYPRLTAVANRNDECNRLVNEQAQIGLLLAGPGVIATLTFAPLVIVLFYSSAFASAVEPLRWICLGLMLRVIAWPMGYIVLAKNKQKIFVWTELAAVLVQLGLTWVFVSNFGLVGAGIGFFGLYVWHGLLIYWIVRNLCGFRWSVANKRLGLIFVPVIGLVFLGFYLLPFWAAVSIGVAAVIFSSIYSIRALLKLIPIERIPSSIRRLLVWLRFVPPA